MSISPGLRSSTSRVMRPASSTLALQPSLRLVRAASSAAAKESKASVQTADQAVKDRERALRRLPPGIDYNAAYSSLIFDRIVDPPFRFSWLFQQGVYGYIKNRVQRVLATQKAAHDLLKSNAIPSGSGWLKWFRQAFWPSLAIVDSANNTFVKAYETYNRAQAKGDAVGLRQVSVGPALDRASKVANALGRTAASNDWSLVRMVKRPKVISVRTSAIDMKNSVFATQIVIRFDTEQSLTSGRPPKQRTTRIVENVVFDRKDLPGSAWVIKDKLETTKAPF